MYICTLHASNKMIGDCPDFPVPWEEGTDRRLVGTVPFSEIILLDALSVSHSRRSADVRAAVGTTNPLPSFAKCLSLTSV